MRRILSGDGGGERGILQICSLIELERQTGKLTREIFDMVAGTSTAALWSAAVAVGIPAKDILPIYTERAPKEIFTGRLTGVTYLTDGYRYQSLNIAKVLRSVFGSAEKWTLNDCPIRILLTAMHVSGTPLYFVQDRPRNAKTTGRLSLIDCATASAAAPTYFTDYYVSPLPVGAAGPFGNELVGHCFDGGVGVAGNPVHQACWEAFRWDDFDPHDTRVISLGTGRYISSQWNRQVNPPQGLIGEASWVIGAALPAISELQTALVDFYYPGIMRRLNPPLPREIDMADMSAIPDLVRIGQEYAQGIDWKELLG